MDGRVTSGSGMKAAISKIQILTDRNLGFPLFYCHRDDRDHEPELTVERPADSAMVFVRTRQMLYKVKQNPQTKNRVDIYMSLAEARALGSVLLEATAFGQPEEWRVSTAQPGAKASGNMKLPGIVWSRVNQCVCAGARVRSGLGLGKRQGYVNVDLEYPDDSFIKMKGYEIHIGIQLDPPSGGHDPGETIPVHVPEGEFQRARNETNPIHKVRGDFLLELSLARAAGLGQLLHAVEAPAAPPGQAE